MSDNAIPQPSELEAAWQSAVNETDRLEREIDLTSADHIALWLEANAISPPLTHQLSWVSCRIAEAHEAQIAKLQADGDKLAGAAQRLIPPNVNLQNNKWPDDTNIPLDVPLGELRGLTQALTEWKDRA